MRTEPERALLRAGHNCWRIEPADRMALLADQPACADESRQRPWRLRRSDMKRSISPPSRSTCA